MRAKVLLIAVGAIVLIGGGGAIAYVWLQSRADQALQAGVDTLKSHLPATVKLDIGGMATHPFSRAAEFTNVTIGVRDDQGPPMTIARLVFSGLLPDADGGVRAEHVVFSDVKATDPANAGGMTIATITLDGVAIPPSVSAGGAFPVKSIRIGAGALDQIAIADDNATGKVTVTLGRLTVGSLKDGMLDGVALHDLHVASPMEDGETVDVTLREVSSSDIDVAALADGSYRTSPKGAIGGMRLADLGATKGAGKLTVASFDFGVTARDGQGRPSAMKLGLDGFKLVPPPMAEQLVKLLQRLGRADLALSLHGDSKQDADARTAVVTETAIVEGMGDFVIQTAIGNLPDAQALDQADATAPIMAATAITIGPTRISWTDHGLVPALEQDVIGPNMTQDQLVQLSESMLRENFAQLGLADATKDWPGKITTFLRKPGHIEIRIDPAQGVAIGSMLDLSQPPAVTFGILKPSLAVDAGP
jgi:hypothetical protein